MAQYAAQRVEAEARAVANPAPLGLSAFALTTFVLSCSNAGFLFVRVGAGAAVVVGLALFYGGVVQLVAGIQEFRAGNTFGATAFCSYAGFWMALGIVLLPPAGLEAALIKEATLPQALGVFLLGWTIFTLLMFLGTLRSNLALMAVLFVLFLTFLALTIGWLVNAGGGYGTTWIRIGGWLGIITALLAWYLALAGVLAAGKSMFPRIAQREGDCSERCMCRDAALRLHDKPAMWYPVIRSRVAEEAIGAFHLRSLSLF